MATRITLLCDYCGESPQWMDKPAKQFLYKADFKFVQNDIKYELCSRECVYGVMRQMLKQDKRNDDAE